MADGVVVGKEGGDADGTAAASSRSVAVVDETSASEAAPFSLDRDRISFDVVERLASRGSSRYALRLWVAGGVALAVGAVFVLTVNAQSSVGGTFAWLLAFGLSLGVVAALALQALRQHRRAPRQRAKARALVLEENCLTLERRDLPRPSAIVESLCELGLEDRFGVILLTNRSRERLVALVTTPAGTMPVATNVAPGQRHELEELFARAAPLSSEDNALFAAGPDGRSIVVEPRAFRDLLGRLLGRDPTCVGRMVLSDQAGRPLLVDDDALVVRGHRLDLHRPLEWRPIHFQEIFGNAVTYYQGTWVRQDAVEVVFVSLLPPAFFDSDVRDSSLDSDLEVREQTRLLNGALTEPPPLFQRVALEGLFVLPMRTALDKAPRAKRASSETTH
jgi:hypothetical protein